MKKKYDRNKIQQLLEEALLGEVETTPKPGLVDVHDNGAHRDMDIETFRKSTMAITPYLTEMADMGYVWDKEPEDLFEGIIPLGIKAEKAMFQATEGVNTHKGAIFTLGILAAACGYVLAKESDFELGTVLGISEKMMKNPMEIVFRNMMSREPMTHGEKLFVLYGEKGIRGEASRGFPIIRECALPAMEYHHGNRINILLEIMTQLSDTCVLSRSDHQGLAWIKEKAREVLDLGGSDTVEGMDALISWNQECIERNISPGGSADILGATIFLWEMNRIYG